MAEPEPEKVETTRPFEDLTLQAEIEPVARTPPDAGEATADVGAQLPLGVPAQEAATEKTSPQTKAPKAKKAGKPPKSEESAGPRADSKTARVVAMSEWLATGCR